MTGLGDKGCEALKGDTWGIGGSEGDDKTQKEHAE